MQDRDHAKTVALLVGIVALVLSVPGVLPLVLPVEWTTGLTTGVPVVARLFHPLVHAGLLHAAVNVYVFWQVVFFCDIRCRHLLCAWVVACCCPVVVASWPWWWLHPVGEPPSVVGLSGVVFFLLGKMIPHSSRPLCCCGILLLWQLPGLLWGTVAVGMHLYALAVGMSYTLGMRWWRVIVRR